MNIEELEGKIKAKKSAFKKWLKDGAEDLRKIFITIGQVQWFNILEMLVGTLSFIACAWLLYMSYVHIMIEEIEKGLALLPVVICIVLLIEKYFIGKDS